MRFEFTTQSVFDNNFNNVSVKPSTSKFTVSGGELVITSTSTDSSPEFKNKVSFGFIDNFEIKRKFSSAKSDYIFPRFKIDIVDGNLVKKDELAISCNYKYTWSENTWDNSNSGYIYWNRESQSPNTSQRLMSAPVKNIYNTYGLIDNKDGTVDIYIDEVKRGVANLGNASYRLGGYINEKSIDGWYDTYHSGHIPYISVNENFIAPPTLLTHPITHIATNSGIGHGEITDDGGEILEKGICWNTTGTPTINDNKEISKGDKFEADIHHLITDTKYYVRAYATNSAGTSYGAVKEFTPTKTLLKLKQESGRGIKI